MRTLITGMAAAAAIAFSPMAIPTAHASPAYPACDNPAFAGPPDGSVNVRQICERACAQNPNGAAVCANYGVTAPPIRPGTPDDQLCQRIRQAGASCP
jgi:hypothetical protein